MKPLKFGGRYYNNASSVHLSNKNEANCYIGLLASTASNVPTWLAYLDILKGIGIILVVMGHVYHHSVFFNFAYSLCRYSFFPQAVCISTDLY